MKEIMKICPLPITTCKRKNEAPPHPFLNGHNVIPKLRLRHGSMRKKANFLTN